MNDEGSIEKVMDVVDTVLLISSGDQGGKSTSIDSCRHTDLNVKIMADGGLPCRYFQKGDKFSLHIFWS